MRFLEKSRKKVVVPLILTMILGSTGAAFAATSETATIPMYISVPATKIDVSVTEKITMTGTGNSTALTINNLDITNNSTFGVVNIDSIELTPTSDWTLKSNIVNFAVLPADSKAFSMVADGTWDFTDGAYTSAGEVQPQATDTTTLSGQTGAAITPVEDQKIADVVVTLSLSRGGSVVEYEDFTLTADNLYMIGYTSGSENLVIPETFEYDGKHYRVTAIGEKVITFDIDIRSITIPSSVTTIGDSAFFDVDRASTITFESPCNIVQIGEDAFHVGASLSTTMIYGANDYVKSYDWAGNNRRVTFE